VIYGESGVRDQAVASGSQRIESTTDLIWSVDLDYRLLSFSPSVQQYVEKTYGTEIAVGMRANDYLPPHSASVWQPLYDMALREGSFLTQYHLSKGKTIELSFKPILVNGKVTGVSVFGKDITHQEAEEKALLESEKKYRNILDNALEGMFQTSSEALLTRANPCMAKMLGYDSVPEFLSAVSHGAGDLWFDSLEHHRFTEQIRKIGAVRGFECRFKCKDGSALWVSMTCRRVLSESGDLLYHEGFVADITERKRAELALSSSEQLFRAVADTSPLAILLLTGSDDSVEYMNPTFTAIFGYSKSEVPTARAWWPLAYPDEAYRDCLIKDWNRKVPRTIGSSATIESIESIVVCKDGSNKHIAWGFVSLGDRNLVCGLDLTERKQAEENLRMSEARYRATFEQAVVGIAHTAFDGRFMLCNARFAEIVGYSPDEIPGMTFQQITPPEDLPQSLQMLQYMSTGTTPSASWEKRYLRKDGKLVWVKVTTSVQRDAKGIPLHYVALVEDIQALKDAKQREAAISEELRQSELRYRTAFETSLDAIMLARADNGVYLDVNQVFLDYTGFTRDEVIGRDSHDLDIWVDRRDRDNVFEAIRANSITRNLDVLLRRKDLSTFWGRITCQMIEIDGLQCTFATVRDITEARASEQRMNLAVEALRHSEERYRIAFQTSHDGVAINRLDNGVYIDVNRAFLEISGFDRQDLIGKTSLECEIWNDPLDRGKLVSELNQNLTIRDYEAQFRRKNGEIFWGLMSASVIEIDGLACILSITRDISNAKVAEEAIKSLAFYDPLTALPNRRLLLEKLQQNLLSSNRSGRMSAVLFVDLDNFKNLNDTLGHPIGDLMLQESARRLTACVRDFDTVARFGGDEFVVILEDLSPIPEIANRQARDVGEKLLATIRTPYLLEGYDCRSSASVGVTLFGAQPDSIDEILKQADIAMYQAKAAGRNTMRFFASALQTAAIARAEMEKDLREAIETSQFRLFYQPQMDGHRMIGAEALIRWAHPRQGILSPDTFIPLAEDSGLVLPLGNWVLHSACLQLALWAAHPQSAAITIAVNISARQLHQPDFVQQVLKALDQTGANPRNLELELTESMLVENVEEVIGKMTTLKEHGLRFSLDDFGTGYSSLSYLKRLPFDQLKIDLSFVRDILMDASSGAIAQTIVSLGKAMNISVIAEGVETVEQRDALSRLGCHLFQGYLFSKPLPLADFEMLAYEIRTDEIRSRSSC
jgi:diguanylate cyclase (GGDEF)-like protein/PAS domain S-box-containing protein